MARVAALALAAMLAAPAVEAQPGPSKLGKPQRAALEAAVAAVVAAERAGEAPASGWQHHVLRASDGSHYVAFGFDVTAEAAAGPLTLYVRLVRRAAPEAVPSAPARSAVAEWLAGMRSDPLPNGPVSVVAVQRGEMPVGGTQAMRARADQAAAGESTTALTLLLRERERARARAAEDARRREAELEGSAVAHPELLPFEDFDLQARALTLGPGRWRLSRSLVAGPGDYDVYVAWAATAPGAKVPVARVVRQRLELPVAPTGEFGVSDLILADAVGVRDVPYGADQQAAHPYAIGAMEITPAPDDVFTNAELVNVVLQVVSPAPDDTGKPDVSVAFRLAQSTAAGEHQVASLSPLTYSAATLPRDFDLRLGQPLFAALAVPLRGLARGDYTLKAVASDWRTRAVAAAQARFRIVGTAATLLAEAPPLWRPFRRDAVLGPTSLPALVEALRPAAASPGLDDLLNAAAAGRYAELLRETPIAAHEQAVGAAIRGLAQYALGDSPTAAAIPLQQALQLGGVAAGPVQALLGACRAAAGNDRDALVAWQAALDAGVPASVLAVAMGEAWLRLRDPARAAAALRTAGTTRDDDALAYARTAAALAAGDTAAALAVADTHLLGREDPVIAFLRLRALYTDLAGGSGHAETRARFAALARTYVDAGGPQAALVEEWAAVLPR